jgi:hypothetical protein
MIKNNVLRGPSLDRKQERVLTGIFLFFICLQLAHFVHNGWFMYAQTARETVTPQRGDTFRLAIPALARLLTRIFHINDWSYIGAGLDLVTGFSALYLLYLLTVDLPAGVPNRPKDRALKILLFLAIIQFPIAWVVPWQRPETMPTALFLAFSLFCIAKIENSRFWSIPLLSAVLPQTFVRADVPVVFGVATAFVGLLSEYKTRTSRQCIVIGCLITLISGGIQVYMCSLYPRAGVDIQFVPNLTFHSLEILTIVLAPFVSFAVFLIANHPPLTVVEKVAIVSALLYLPLYFTFGAVAEARIYVPFLLSLCMVVARVSASLLSTKFNAPT